jgi:hypothetical protein
MFFKGKKEEERTYTLHFLILVILLIIFSVWAYLDETVSLRPWKNYQKQYYALKSQKTTQELEKTRKEFEKPEVQEKYNRLRNLYEDAESAFQNTEKQKEYSRLLEQLSQIEKELTKNKDKLLVARNRLQEQEYLYMKFGKDTSKKKIVELSEKISRLEEQQEVLSKKKMN